MARREEETWITFEDDEEALSLSDLPVVDRGEDGGRCRDGDGETAGSAAEAEDFEFRTLSGGTDLESAEVGMCAADEVFFQGQILPMRPSVSSDGGLFPACSRGPSRCGSRSESMDRYSSATGSLGFESSRSLSGGSSSSISRSQSTHSSNSVSSSSVANDGPPRLSLSNNFYAHPSPKPQVCSRRRSTGSACRKSTSSAGAGWGILRLGLVKTPEIDLNDALRHRNNAATKTDQHRRAGDDEGGKKKAPVLQGNNARCSNGGGGGGGGSGKLNARSADGGHREEKKAAEKKASRSFGSRLRGCSCSSDDVVDATCSRIVVAGGAAKSEGGCSARSARARRLRQDVMCHHSRTYEWLAELSVPKPPVA